MVLLFIYLVFSSVIWFLISLSALFFKKGRERLFNERKIYKTALKNLKEKRQNKQVIIMHAASAGEFEQLKPILPLIDREKYLIVQTFSSPTIYRKEYSSDLFDVVMYHPLDSITKAFSFFKKIKPDLYILNRHDLWPAHLFVAKILGIKSVLINANMHERSGRYKFPVRSLNRWMFESLTLILCGSKRIKDGIYKLAPNAKVEIIGESRFDQVIERSKKNLKNHFDEKINDKDNIVLGSIIQSDYDVLFKGIKKLKDNNRSFRVIAVPHEVADKDVVILEDKLKVYGFSFHRYSESKLTNNSDVIIVDSVGILAELYVYAHCAYVGAGFGAGVHNVIEPAVYGVPTFFGPNYQILDEAVAMVEKSIATVVNNENDVYTYLKKLEDSSQKREITERTENFVKSVNASSEKILNRILDLVK